MGFCKICTGRRKPGMNIKIVVNLKKDIVCRECEKHFEVKASKRRGLKKLVIFISRLSYCVRPNRRGGAHRLLLPISRTTHDRPKEIGWLDFEIDGGSGVGDNWLIPGFNLNMDLGNIVHASGYMGLL